MLTCPMMCDIDNCQKPTEIWLNIKMQLYINNFCGQQACMWHCDKSCNFCEQQGCVQEWPWHTMSW